MRIYFADENVIAGITLKDATRKEANNMALHACRDKEAVIANRKHLAALLDVRLDDFVCAEQTHRDQFYHVTAQDRGRGAYTTADAIRDTDALFTTEQNILLGVFTADCVPVFFYEPTAGVIGVIHSGWRGTVQEITPKTLTAVSEQFAVKPDNFYVQIGLALSQKRFEVDRDVYEAFLNLGYVERYIAYHAVTQKFHIDQQLVIQQQCVNVGIPKEQIKIDRTCTYDSAIGFSYRQDKQAGRHFAFIMKK